MENLLEQVLELRERLLYSFTRSVVSALSFLLLLSPLGRQVAQARMVPTEGTLIIKSAKVSALGCK